ncbi:uncharacterized protein METZ01_LOCUS117579 [marine metagenome]|uniref:Uncharacterized protein n=1 Tax=marine metagenome TaxID=408172 RepID=A0A381XIY9_9ZZZZ
MVSSRSIRRASRLITQPPVDTLMDRPYHAEWPYSRRSL